MRIFIVNYTHYPVGMEFDFENLNNAYYLDNTSCQIRINGEHRDTLSRTFSYGVYL